MKNQNKGSVLKSLFSKKIVFLGILATIAASCGSDSNRISDSTSTFSDGITPGGPSMSHVQNTLNVQCAQGGSRLPDEVFHTNEVGLNQLYGPFNNGPVPSGGNISTTYVGVSAFGDIMTVSKVTNGAQVIGYNVVVSYCPYSTYQGYPLISTNRAHRTEIGALVLDQDNFCGFGSVDAASTRVHLDAWQGTTQQGYVIQDRSRTLDVTYFKANCNGQY